MKNATESKRGCIEKRVLIKASPAIIFQALTDGRDLTHWFCDGASSDPREGGELEAVWNRGKTSLRGRAVFTQFEPGSTVELLWIDDGDGDNTGSTHHVLRYAIRSVRGGSEVTMRDEDSRMPDEESYSILEQGWNGVLLELKDYCERRERSSKPRPAERIP